jgi:cysteine desulfurase
MSLLEEHGKPKKEVYLDGENSGFVPDEVIEAILPYFNKVGYGHPSITHRPGWEAYQVMMEHAKILGDSIGAEPQRLVFTSGGTEANNLAIMGAALANRDKGKKLVTSSIEHLSIIHPAKKLEKLGYELVEIPVDSEGFFDLEALAEAVDKETVLVSLMAVNHEIGTIEPVKEAVKIVKEINPEVIFHTDACDAYGKVPLNVKDLGVDLMTLSGHKIHAPRGIGALYVKEGIRLEPVLHGQLSVNELRPGVENIPLIVGFAKASELAFKDFEANVSKLRRLRDELLEGILEKVKHALLNGPKGDLRAPDNVNISFLYCEGEAITVELSLHGVYVSSGSACTSRILEPSHVLKAIGRRHDEAHGSILMKVTRYHTEEDIEYVLEVLPGSIKRLVELSPVKPGGE